MLRVLSTLHRPGYLWLGAPHFGHPAAPRHARPLRWNRQGRAAPRFSSASPSHHRHGVRSTFDSGRL